MVERTHTVLVVDDDDDVRDALREVLEERRYMVLTARNGHDALKALSVVRVALVLLDLSMPEMNGWEFLERKAADPKIASVPVVVVTAMAAAVVGPVEPRVAEVLRKPLGARTLLESVQRYVAAPDT